MSDIASSTKLAPAVSQFPVEWYFDEKMFELEMKLFFEQGPGYVGHDEGGILTEKALERYLED